MATAATPSNRLLLLLLPLGATGCAATGPEVFAPITVRFEHQVDGEPLELGTDTPYTNASGDAYGVTRLTYFVSGLALTTGDGHTIRADDAHYVDHADPETWVYAFPGEVPLGTLAAVDLVMGLTPALNVTGGFSQPPESLMEWPEIMGGGYHFMRHEGHFVDADGGIDNYTTHTGALDGVDYSIPISLDAGDAAIPAEGVEITLVMEIQEWYTNPTDWDFDDHVIGIMDDADAQATLQDNGADVFSLGAVVPR